MTRPCKYKMDKGDAPFTGWVALRIRGPLRSRISCRSATWRAFATVRRDAAGSPETRKGAPKRSLSYVRSRVCRGVCSRFLAVVRPHRVHARGLGGAELEHARVVRVVHEVRDRVEPR